MKTILATIIITILICVFVFLKFEKKCEEKTNLAVITQQTKESNEIKTETIKTNNYQKKLTDRAIDSTDINKRRKWLLLAKKYREANQQF